jgi:hypothetical protein
MNHSKPGYTNAHKQHADRCFSDLATAQQRCEADPTCTSVGCSEWLGGTAQGCEPRNTCGGACPVGAWEGQTTYKCSSTIPGRGPSPTRGPYPGPGPAPGPIVDIDPTTGPHPGPGPIDIDPTSDPYPGPGPHPGPDPAPTRGPSPGPGPRPPSTSLRPLQR